MNQKQSDSAAPLELFSYRDWRNRFLNTVLGIASILGLIGIGVFWFTVPSTASRILALVAFGLLVLITLARRLSYPVRAGIFLVLLYVGGLIALGMLALAEASILFLSCIALTGFLFSPRTVVYILVGIATFLILVMHGWDYYPLGDLVRFAAVFLFIGSVLVIGLHTFQVELDRTRQTAGQHLQTLWQDRSLLEQKLEEQSAGLNRKTEQLRATSYIARRTAEVQDLSTLLTLVANLVKDQFGFYHTGIFLLNETGEEAILQAASSEGGLRMIERGHSLAADDQSIVGHVVGQKKPRIALDVGEDAVFFNNPDLPMTRSELALPLMVYNRILGVLDIQSDKPQAFRDEDIDVLQTLADQVAVAIENTRLLDESQAALSQLEALTSFRTSEAWSERLREKSRVFTYTPLGLRAEGVRQPNGNTVTVPLILRGQKIGSISIARKGDAPLGKRDRDLIAEVAGQAGLAIENIRLLEEATRRADQEQVVGMLAGKFSQSLDTETLLQTAVRELAQLPDVSEVSVFISRPAGGSSAANKTNRRGPG